MLALKHSLEQVTHGLYLMEIPHTKNAKQTKQKHETEK